MGAEVRYESLSNTLVSKAVSSDVVAESAIALMLGAILPESMF